MADLGQLTVRIDSDTSGLQTGLNRTSTAVKKAGKAIGGFALAAGVAMTGVSVKAISLAADAEEVQNKFDVTFKTLSEDAEAWADTWSSAVGRSKNETKKFISNIADLQQGLGMTEESSLDLAQKIVELGTDLASFNNVNDATAIEAVTKAMLGEAESAKQLGLLLNVDRVKEFAAAQGLVFKELTDSEKALLTYELAVTQSQNAIGDAERSSGSFTNQLKELKAGLADNAAEFGEKLLPMATKLITYLNDTAIPVVLKMTDDFIAFAQDAKPVVEETFNTIVDVATEMWEYFNDNILPIILELKETAIEVFEAIKPVAIDMFEVIVEKATIWWNFFTENILPVIEKLHSTAIKLFPIVQDIAVTAFEGIKTTAMILWGVFENNLLPIIKAVFNFVNDNWGVFETIIVTAFTVIKVALDVAITVFTTFWDSLRQGFDYVQTVFSTISDIIGLAFDNVVTSVQNVIDVFTRVKDTIQKAIDALKEFFKQEKKGDSDSSGGRGEKGGSNTVRGQRAFGGAVKAGESYLINEGSGGEIFTPSTNGTVSPGMGNVTINVNGAGDPYVIANQIVTILNTQGVKSR